MSEGRIQGITQRELSPGVWMVANIAILIEAAILRFYDLGLRPLHHDEGVNGSFLVRLFREGLYRYDPSNYHGPSLYYAGLISTYVFGLNTEAIRIVPAVFGILTVWLALCLRKEIGEIGALAAAALLAVSPGAVYFSRYYIHESMFVFFTFAIVVAILRYRIRLQFGYLLLACAAGALLFATKETSIISIAVLIIAAATATLYVRLRRVEVKQDRLAQHEERRLKQSGRLRAGVSGCALFLLITVVLYSSFFTNPSGPADSIRAFGFWVHTGRGQHIYPWYQYIYWLSQEEASLLVLGSIGAGFSIWRPRSGFSVFVTLWAAGSLAAYSILPYKTPWITLNCILPLALLSGYSIAGLTSLSRSSARWLVSSAALFLATALAVSVFQTIRLNFFYFDDDRYPYVYAHTRRELLKLIGEVDEIAARAGSGRSTTIAVTSPEYWPLPWYLRNYGRVGYYGRVVQTNDTIIIGSEQQEPELQSTLGESYRRLGSFPLRPGVFLVIYVNSNRIQY